MTGRSKVEEPEDRKQILENNIFREVDQVYEPDFDKVDEDFVQKLWNAQRFFNKNLISIDGRDIRILKPGVWNHDEGPDFMHAEIEINGKLLVGDIEIHVKSSEWYTHKHHLNSRYNRVVLHTVLYNDDFNLRTRLQNGKRIPTLELLKWIDAPIGDLFDDTKQKDTDEENYCRVTGNRLNLDGIKSVFLSLGEERFLEKADSVRLLRTRLNFEQILYEGIMEALGYSHNSKPLRELAQCVPFEELDHKSEHEIQAILFGVAGLLPSQSEKFVPQKLHDDPYVVTLEKLWNISEYSSQQNRMTASQWNFGRIRPTNFPTRRIAAMSQLIYNSKGSLMMYFLPTCERVGTIDTHESMHTVKRQLLNLLMLEPFGYWETHSNFGKGGTRNSKLIGEDRATDILVNKVLPIAYIWAVESQSQILQNAILRVYGNLKKLQPNKIIRKVDENVFNEIQTMNKIKPNAKIQQGIIRLYNNYCADKLCDLCPIIENRAIISKDG